MTLSPHLSRSYLENRSTYIAEICMLDIRINVYKGATFKANRRRPMLQNTR